MPANPHIPQLLPLKGALPEWGGHERLAALAAAGLGQFAGMMEATAKADVFWLMWILREAQASNAIEGTVTSVEEVLESQIGVPVQPDRREDVREVANYRAALQSGAEMLASGMPFNLFLIRSLHAMLLEGVRGQDRRPGSWRSIQVHIGRPGANIAEAAYIPPPPDLLAAMLDNLERFCQRDDLEPLLQTAVFHAQFEMIHPFLDGNGRIGRLLISLLLKVKGMLASPSFYLSAWLLAHRQEYYARLGGVSERGAWGEWIAFFLEAILDRSRQNICALRQMASLYEKTKAALSGVAASPHGIKALDYAFANPIFTLPGLAAKTGLSLPTATNTVKRFAQAGIFSLRSPGRGRQAATWQFDEFLSMLKSQ